jgi:ribosome recycling factor
MESILSDFKQNVEKAITYLKEDLKSIRTGRATPALLENLIVEAYGGTTKMNLSSLATITTESSTALLVSPFDSSILQEIERAIQTSALGLTPRVEGSQIHVLIPSLSQEQREKFIKIVGTKVEERKNIIRGFRDESRKKVKTQLESKQISEDDKYRLEKEIDEITQAYMEDVQIIKDRKEEEIRQI